MTRYATVNTVQVHFVLSAIPKIKVTSHSYLASEMNIIIIIEFCNIFVEGSLE